MIDQRPATADDLAVNQLRSFCIVFEKQSYSAAAKQIGLSVPTIWEQVRLLEKRYRTLLFARRGRRIEPTPAAALLYESLRPLLTGLDSTFELLREEAGDYPRTVTLVTGARMMLEDLGPCLKQFRDRYPNTCLRLSHHNDKAAADLIAAGEADLALTLEPGPGVLRRDVSVERAYKIEYLALFPKRHPLAATLTPHSRRSHHSPTYPPLNLAALASHPLIIGHPGTYGRQLLEQAFHHEGLMDRVQIVAETDTSAFTIACVRAGMGVGIIAGRERGFLCRGLAVRSLHTQLGEAWIAFLWKRGKHLTSTVQTLIQLIRASGVGVAATQTPSHSGRGLG